MIKTTFGIMLLLAGVLTGGLWFTSVQAHMPQNANKHGTPGEEAVAHSRQEVVFPSLLKRQTLATMRMHLQGLGEIQQALAEHHFDKAAQIATLRLGMSSMHGKQMEQEAHYMPPGMKRLGAQMHRQAGEFAVAAQNAAISGDIDKPLLLLSRVTQTCVACHATYRLR